MENEKEWEEELDSPKDPLKPKERILFELIKKNKGIITFRQIMDELGFSSTSVVARYIDNLNRKGFIRKVTGYVTKDEKDIGF